MLTPRLINTVFFEDISNGLRLGIRMGFEQVADFDGAGLLVRIGVLFAAPDQESDDGGKDPDDQKFHGVEPMFRKVTSRIVPNLWPVKSITGGIG